MARRRRRGKGRRAGSPACGVGEDQGEHGDGEPSRLRQGAVPPREGQHPAGRRRLAVQNPGPLSDCYHVGRCATGDPCRVRGGAAPAGRRGWFRTSGGCCSGTLSLTLEHMSHDVASAVPSAAGGGCSDSCARSTGWLNGVDLARGGTGPLRRPVRPAGRVAGPRLDLGLPGRLLECLQHAAITPVQLIEQPSPGPTPSGVMPWQEGGRFP